MGRTARRRGSQLSTTAAARPSPRARRSGACFSRSGGATAAGASAPTAGAGPSRFMPARPAASLRPTQAAAGGAGGGTGAGGAAKAMVGLHDPSAAGAVVLNPAEWRKAPARVAPVVVDPWLSRHLRPHQVHLGTGESRFRRLLRWSRGASRPSAANAASARFCAAACAVARAAGRRWRVCASCGSA